MKADHKFYKAHGIYDFPQKQKKRHWILLYKKLWMSVSMKVFWKNF